MQSNRDSEKRRWPEPSKVTAQGEYKEYGARMNLGIYVLSVSLVAAIGLLVVTVPLVRSVLEYRSPAFQAGEPDELGSLEAFVLANEKDPSRVNKMINNRGSWNYQWGAAWQTMYERAMAQHAETARRQVEVERSKAAHNTTAYGALFAVCAVLFTTHLLWARRVFNEPRGRGYRT